MRCCPLADVSCIACLLDRSHTAGARDGADPRLSGGLRVSSELEGTSVRSANGERGWAANNNKYGLLRTQVLISERYIISAKKLNGTFFYFVHQAIRLLLVT